MSKKDDKKLEAALANMQKLEPSVDLQARILSDAENLYGPKTLKTLWPFGKVWQPITALAAAMALGIWLGFVITTPSTSDVEDEIEIMLLG